ncbi:hypothetical protein D3C72_755280 [compost metagenome]
MIRRRSAEPAGVRPRWWRRSREAQRGMALLNAMLLAMVFAMMIVAGTSFTQTAQKAGRSDKYESQAYHVARAGIVDTINYFKRQASQPVEKFRPAYNAAVPTKGDTNDPSQMDPGAAGGKLHKDDPGGGNEDKPHLGIVQEFQLDPRDNLWGRYEVGKVTKLKRGTKGKLSEYVVMEKDASGNWVERTALSAATSKEWEGVEDLTSNYGLVGKGLIWRIRSKGYVYRKATAPDDTATRFYQYPNEALAQVEVETEIRRLHIENFEAAIHGNTNTSFVNANKIDIVAPDGYAVKYNGGTLSPASAPGSFSGTSGKYKLVAPANSLDWMQMFAVANGPTLASMADSYVTDLSQLPDTMSSMALTYIQGNATFTNTRRLNGGGILVVDGNLRLEQNSASTFAGVVYVSGDYFQGSTSAIVGQVVVKGTVRVEPVGDKANIEYSSGIVSEVRRQLGQYRERRSAQRTVN